MVDVVIMSGTNPARPVNGEACKGMLEYKGRTLVEHVFTAMCSAHQVDDIYIVGPQDRLTNVLANHYSRIVTRAHHGKRVSIVGEHELTDTEGDGFVNNLKHALHTRMQYKKAPKRVYDNYVLFSAVDVPNITRHAIDDFIINCECRVDKRMDKEGITLDYIHSAVPLDKDLANYDGLTKKDRRGIPFKDGAVRPGNFGYAHADSMLTKEAVVNLMYTVRKGKEHPFKTARAMFGYWGTLKMAVKQCSVKYFRKHVARKYGIHVDMVPAHPLVAADIDTDAEFTQLRSQ